MDYSTRYKADYVDLKDYYPDIPGETLELMVSMLQRAQQDLISVNYKDYCDAKRWVERRDQQDYFLSFDSICRYLNLDTVKAREMFYEIAEENKVKKEHFRELKQKKKAAKEKTAARQNKKILKE